MIKAFELWGLDYPALCELTGFLMALISFGVFFGILMYDAFDLFCDILHRVFSFLRKRIFPNVRKKKH